ncbi:hypothetical protein AHiyo6_04140 [Arthrobacter sp. Hiyo6]|nr:hypothetical protein AHiyo6_04140 [Arthrobacter sp. Hiyo6]
MSTEPDEVFGYISASIVAGHIKATKSAAISNIGKQVAMSGSTTMLYIKPDVARQWIGVLEQIAEGGAADGE